MSYNFAHTFYLSSDSVKGSATAQLSAIDLYFKFKPRSTNNKSGIDFPGATLIICPTDLDNKPIISPNENYALARLEYDQILASSDAALPSRFEFTQPAVFATNKWYAFAIKFDGNEDFIPWTSVKGDRLIGSQNSSPGSSDDYTGNYFTMVRTESSLNVASSTSDLMVTGSSDESISSLWRPQVNTFLKFRIYAARYFIDGEPIDTVGNITYEDGKFYIPLNFHATEYVAYDHLSSSFGSRITHGVKVYQNTAFHPGGWANGSSSISVSITTGNTIIVANTRYPNGALFDWNSIYEHGEDAEYIVITSESHSDGEDKVFIGEVRNILSNTQLQVIEEPTFSNNSAKFFKSPVATIHDLKTHKFSGYTQGMLTLFESNANDSIRFVSGAVESTTIADGGSGYNNADTLYVFGYEFENDKFEGGYLAVANLVTNSSGGINSIHFSNIGAYFMNSSSVDYCIANSSSGFTGANTSAGSSANIVISIGSVLKAETFDQDQFFKGCVLYNQPISTVSPTASIIAPIGTTFKMINQSIFERQSSATLEDGFYDRPAASPRRDLAEISSSLILPPETNAVNMSYSSQFFTYFANGVQYVPLKQGAATLNTARAYIEGTTNNDFTGIAIRSPQIFYRSYTINNDYTLENTDHGNAWSKYISTKINFREGAFAEDLIVYLTGHRPVGTDFQVFARLHNSTDTEDEFDDKDWTRLELTNGSDLFSDPTNDMNVYEFTYGIPQSPNTDLDLAGSVTVSTGNNEIVGAGTNFDGELVSGDVVKIYQPLFPNNHFLAVVNTVSTDELFTIDSTTSNSSVLGSGMLVQRIRTYKKQGFRNHQNDNCATYFAENGAMFEKYDTFAIKIVLLSNTAAVVPFVENIRAIGTTA